jgi:HK97 family phage portal protein
MPVLLDEGRIVQLNRAPGINPGGSMTLYQGVTQTYSALYRAQPNVRTCVKFLARNIAQLDIHVYRRLADNDRERLNDHPYQRVLDLPNPFTTSYRAKSALVHDLNIYGNAYWLKLKPRRGSSNLMALVRIPPAKIVPVGDNWIYPDAYEVRGGSGTTKFSPDQVVHFRFYNPDDDRVGVSPLESLRRILSEESAAGSHREQVWRNAARVSGIIRRPKASGKWSESARDRFRESWQARWTGADAGGTPILEDDMEYIQAAFSPVDMQYLEQRKLTREEAASAFFIPPPMVGILDHATFSNIEEQHKMTYQDTLGPSMKMVVEDLELQLMPDFDDVAGVYAAFNIDEKLKGSFEQQAEGMARLTGVPVVAVNEGRARLDLPRIDNPDYDVPVRPLSVLYGGGATSPDVAPGETVPPKSRGMKAIVPAGLVDNQRAKHAEVLTAFFTRQGESIKAKVGAKSQGAKAAIDDVWDDERWDTELAGYLFALATATAQAFGDEVAKRFDGEYDVEAMGLPWLQTNTGYAASGINATTKAAVASALAGESVAEDVAHVFLVAISGRVPVLSADRTTAAGNFGQIEAARAVGRPEKVWVVTSANPRPEHAAMDGESVPIDEAFSNGGMWPGDPSLPSAELAGCQCLLDFA